MSVEMARNIHRFLASNDVPHINIMGGEIFCNPMWREILPILTEGRKLVRIISNGDWVTERDFPKVIASLGTHVYVHISRDRWHTNKNVDEALRLLKEQGIPCRATDPSEATDSSIVPIGRGELEAYGGFYSMMGCYCQNPEHQYAFLIDELGEVYKCGFGGWNYANVKEYLEGGFRAEFKRFNTLFYKAFIGSCVYCRQAEQHLVAKTSRS